MPDPKESPAVLSMKTEQAEQKRRSRKGELEKGLEGTFPASDPVSITRTTVPAGRTDISETKRVRDNDDEYPLVGNVAPAAGDVDRREIAPQGRSLWSDMEHRIRKNPLTAVGIVASVAFLLGATR